MAALSKAAEVVVIHTSKFLFIRSQESSCLDVLEERRSGREAGRIEECAVEHPVSDRRVVNLVTAFECTRVISRIEKVDQRSGIVQPLAVPTFEEPLEVMDTAIQTR